MNALQKHLSAERGRARRLAQRLDVAASTICRIASGKAKASFELAARISGETGLAIETILQPDQRKAMGAAKWRKQKRA